MALRLPSPAGHPATLAVLAVLALATTAAAQEPPVPEAVRLHVEHGQFAEALEALGSATAEETPAHRYLRGRLLEWLGRDAEAAEALDLTETLPASILEDAALRRGSLLTRLGRCEPARPALLRVRRTRDAQVARALMAQCLLRDATDTESRAAAITALRAVAAEAGRDVDTFAVQALLAEALDLQGDAPAATTIRRRLYIERPEHPDAALLPVPTDLSIDETLRRADELADALRHADAVALLDGGPPSGASRSQQATWLHQLGMALYKTRHHYDRAAEILRRASRLGGSDALEDEFHAARALSRADQDADAIRAYRRFARTHRRHRRAAEAEYLAAWLELRTRPAAGRRAFERYLRGAGRTDGRRRSNAEWHLGMGAFDAGNHTEAARRFTDYAGNSRDPMRGGRGLYWAGRAHHLAGRTTRAAALYRQVRAMDPLHWYGLHAEKRLAELGITEDIPLRAAGEATPLPTPPLPADVELLLGLGLASDARERLARLESSLREAAPRGRRAEYIVAAYQRVGDAYRGFRRAVAARSQLNTAPSGSAEWAWRGAYPRPHEAVVRREAARHGIPFEHVYATMRQESQYEPQVVSRADAIGLLQLIPASAQSAARRLGVPYARDRLFDPEYNIQLGVGEMVGLWRRFDGAIPLVIAAYNAGAARVTRWIRELGPAELDLFVERIPFDETRNYVRRVTSHFARYRYMEDPTGRPPLPARVPVSED